ncbi:MAG: NUDIX domain-containing protein [Candidatus Levybacteria bacterium]|nr:NUDIX domain-containing protein [Candidatus Levybacteria bacterium]
MVESADSKATMEAISGRGLVKHFKIKNYKPPEIQKPGDELFPLMDKKGSIIGSVSRTEAHSKAEKIHAGVGILIVDRSLQEIYLPMRGPKKDKDPNCLDFSTGEHSTILDQETGQLETWNQTAKRGITEETGLNDNEFNLVRIPGHRLDEDDPTQTEWQTFFIVELERRRFNANQEEIAQGGSWFKIRDLLEIVDGRFSENNKLKDYTIRPMLLSVLGKDEVRKAIEKLITSL